MLAVFIILSCQPALAQNDAFVHGGTYTVVIVWEGDTFVTTDGNDVDTVRLIGINTLAINNSGQADDEAKELGVDVQTIVQMGQKATVFVV